MAVTALFLVLTLLAGILTGLPGAASAADNENGAAGATKNYFTVGIKYDQSFTNNSSEKKVASTFTYLLKAEDGAPMPQGSTKTGYKFKINGTTSGTLNLKIPFTSPGFYAYTVDSYAPSPKKGYSYDPRVYTVTVMVRNQKTGDGLEIGSVTIQNQKLAKFEELEFKTSYYKKSKEKETKPTEKATTKAAETTKAPSKPRETRRSSPASPARPASPASPAPTSPTETSTTEEETLPVAPTAAPETPPETSGEAMTEPSTEAPTTAAPETTAPADDGEGEEEDYWALLNLLLMIATCVICIVVLMLYFKRKDEVDQLEEGDKRRTNGLIRILSIIPAVVSVILFVLTEDITLPMEWTDEWTIWMIVILVVEIIVALLSRIGKKVEGDEEEAEASA